MMTFVSSRPLTTAESDLVAEIKDRLTSYSMSKIDLTTFNEWFTPTAWNIEAADDPQAEDLVDDVTLLLAEYDYGHWSEDQLKELLLKLVTQSRFVTYTVHTTDVAPMSNQDHPGTSGWRIQKQDISKAMAESRL